MVPKTAYNTAQRMEYQYNPTMNILLEFSSKYEHTCARAISGKSLSIAMVTGNVFGFVLYGVLTLQMYLYFITILPDSKMFKSALYAIYFVETVSTALLAYDLTNLTINPHYDICFAVTVFLICGGLVGLITKAVYANCIWNLMGRKKFVPICFVVFTTIEVVLTTVLISCKISFFIIGTVWSACYLLADLAIAITMVWILTKRRIINEPLRRKLKRLVYLLVGGGILTVALDIVTLAASLHSIYLTFSCAIILSKLYANSVMCVVNHRGFRDLPDENITSLPMGPLQTGGQ